MIRRWFAVGLMAWASVATLFAFAPVAQAAGETFTFASATTITSTGGDLGNVTFNGSGNSFSYNAPCNPGRFQSGIAHYTVTVGAKKTGGGYDAKIATIIGGSCPGSPVVNDNTITIGDTNKLGPNGGSPPAAGGGTNGSGDPLEAAPQCDAGQAVFTWIICGAIRTIVDVVDWIRDNIIVPFLVEKPLDNNDPNVKPVFLIWTAFRNIASVFFILIFFLVIFGTAIGWDNYTVKKILPRLVLGAVLVPFSWYVCALVVDLGNVLGQGLVALTSSVIPPANIDFTSSISKIFLGGTIALGVAGAATALATVSLGVLVSMLIAFALVFFTLVLRKILIILLVVISPFAFLAWILPNTSKWFKEWWDNFFKLVLMYPVVMMLFEAGRLFAATAGATAGNKLENGVTPLFQIVGLTLPLFGVPFAFSWAGKGLKAGQGAIGKVAGAADKRFGKDSQMAKERAETRKSNNAMRALDSSNRIGGKKIGFDSKSLGALKRAGALKRSGYGGFTSNIPGYGKIPMLSKPMNAAAKQKLNSADAKAKSDLAQSRAYDQMRRDQPKTAKEAISDQSAAVLGKLKADRKAEESRNYKTSSAKGHHSNGVAIEDVPLDRAEGIADLQKIASEAYAEGNMSRVGAVLTRLSQSNGGIDGAQELAMGRIGEYTDKEGKKHLVGGNGYHGADEDGKVHFEADGVTPKLQGRSLLGGEYGQIDPDTGVARTARNVSDENLEMWRDSMKGAKGFDVNKPIPAGATDISADEIAGEHHTAIKRRLAYAEQASASTDARTQSSGIQSAKDLSEAADLIANSQILTGKVAAKSKNRLAEGGAVFVPNAVGSAATYMQPVVQPAAANAFAKMIAPAPAPSAVAPGTAAHIVGATGHDITQVANITEHITNEIKASPTNTSVTLGNIENHILEHGKIDAAGLVAAGAPPPAMGPMTAAQAAQLPPAKLSAEIADKFKDNLEAIHSIERHYTNQAPAPEMVGYREKVNSDYLSGRPVTLPEHYKPPTPSAP